MTPSDAVSLTACLMSALGGKRTIQGRSVSEGFRSGDEPPLLAAVESYPLIQLTMATTAATALRPKAITRTIAAEPPRFKSVAVGGF